MKRMRTAKPRLNSKRARVLGRMSTPAKRRAVRQNGKLGGRKRKFQIGDRVCGRDKGDTPASFRGELGTIAAFGTKSQFGVRFDTAPHEINYLMSWWLDRER
jgi:hypothetical protein